MAPGGGAAVRTGWAGAGASMSALPTAPGSLPKVMPSRLLPAPFAMILTRRRPSPLGTALTPTAGRGEQLSPGVGGTVGVAVAVGVLVEVAVAVEVGVAVRVAVGGGVGVREGTGVLVGVGVSVGSGPLAAAQLGHQQGLLSMKRIKAS